MLLQQVQQRAGMKITVAASRQLLAAQPQLRHQQRQQQQQLLQL
jgi:hypothetical protein